jgi:hypothetical protein
MISRSQGAGEGLRRHSLDPEKGRTMMKSRHLLAACVALAASPLLVACSDDD